MKKVLVVIFTACLLLVPGQVYAQKGASIDEQEIILGYERVKTYYRDSHEAIQSYYDIYAMFALGIPIANDRIEIQGMLTQDFTSMPAHTLAQNMIALVMAGINPRQVGTEKLDTVALLESYVGENGVIDKDGKEETVANLQVWCLYALEIVEADYDAQACYTYLQSLEEEGGYGFGYGADADVSAWVLEAFLLHETYKEDAGVERLVQYLMTSQHSDGTWGDWGANANTQSSVLQAYSMYDKAGIIDGTYSKEGNPMAALLVFQNEAGWFGYMDNTEYNWYATYQAAMALGSYYHGSLYIRANEAYQELVAEVVSPVDPAPSDEVEEIEDTKTSTNEKVEVVPTGDATSISLVKISCMGMVLITLYCTHKRKEE